MRVLAGLAVVAAGCNQVFGLDPTDPVPDAPPVLPRVHLTWQVFDRRAAEPTARIEHVPIEPAPVVRIGRIGAAWTNASYLPDGSIEIPLDYPGTNWRLEYTIDGVAHEVHWNPGAGDGFVVVPRAGHLARDGVPAGSGYRISATNGPPSHPRARLFTTGVWSDGDAVSATAGLDYPFANARSLSGPLGMPDATRGDRAALIDIEIMGACYLATRAVTFAPPPLTAGALSSIAAIYGGDSIPAAIEYSPGLAAPLLIATALGDRWSQIVPVGRTLVGHVPSQFAPDFVEPTRGLQPVAPALPASPLVPVADCTGLPAAILPSRRPVDVASYPVVLHAEMIDERRILPNGPVLVSGIAASSVAASSMALTDNFTLETRVPLATAPIRLGPIDLVAADRTAVPIASSPTELTFAVDDVAHVHYYEVVLYEVVSGASPMLIPRRIYRSALPVLGATLSPSITFDPQVLAAGTEYVFAIRGVLGRPLAFAGDYTRTEYPQAMSTIFTRTFVGQ